ncbi:hypothetical protein M3221_13440 [Domibacillus indicus]|uniref:hypothetical protein n=1 Tax=Domibacillus indicus TaxID=1437523 RepID=UPI0020417518|nr:hypothetical protein [Domibacillus indicus]MCM3789404.1 hypothetical protein [Domibacillus indicus]
MKVKANCSLFLSELLQMWHRYNYFKYKQLEADCINKRIRKEFEEKKLYHYEKYTDNFNYYLGNYQAVKLNKLR